MKHSVHTDVIYLDLSKAFDSVPHNELLVKLWSSGITGHLWNWFRFYLTNRSQVVCINHQYSDPLPVLSGVPQGSILGPMLFITYINDMSAWAHFSKLLFFADDTKCYKSIHNLSDSYLLQEDLNSLATWSSINHIYFNSSKTVLLRFCSKLPSIHFDYVLDNQQLRLKDSHWDLGVIISSNLTWTAHHNCITADAYRILSLIRRTFRHTTSIGAKKFLYLSLVKSRLTYCSQLWRPYLLKEITKLEKVQRRATKYILNDFSLKYKSRLSSLRILPLMMTFDIIFFIKSVKSPTTAFNINNFVEFRFSSSRSSSGHKLIHRLSYSNTTRHFYFNRLPRLWNSLPFIDLNLSVEIIKKQLKRFYWSHFLQHFDSSNLCTFHYLCPCSKCSSTPCIYNYNSLSSY